MYVCTYVRMYVCTYVRMYVRMYVCTYVYMYVCAYVRMYVYTLESIMSQLPRFETWGIKTHFKPFVRGWAIGGFSLRVARKTIVANIVAVTGYAKMLVEHLVFHVHVPLIAKASTATWPSWPLHDLHSLGPWLSYMETVSSNALSR